MLYNSSQNDVYLRTLNNLTNTKYTPPPKAPLYNPQEVVIPEKQAQKEVAPPPPQVAQPQPQPKPTPQVAAKPSPPPPPQRPAPPSPPSPQKGVQPNLGDSFSVYGEE